MRFSLLARFARFFFIATLAALALILLAPGCGRSSLEDELLDAEAGTSTCSPQTCPGGCCDRSGQCRTGTDLRFCGQLGNACSDCAATGFDTCGSQKTCSRSGCANCRGCCDRSSGTERCVSGIDANACGVGGASCTDCSVQGRACDITSGACTTARCGPDNCKGCCVGDKCLPGTDPLSCGQSGQQCISCATQGQTCQSTGGGGRCVGTPTCGPANCNGCCNGNTCVTGADSTACGTRGAACRNCAATGQTCNGATRVCETPVTCNAANCPGCCAGNNCVIATTPAACGKGGQACFACAPNEACNAGVCQPAATCSPATCNGCCIGNLCAAGNQNTACGLGGLNCENCSGQNPQRVCQAGTCQLFACGPGNCAGCCQGNTCVIGTGDTSCGGGGAACSDCTANGRVCNPGSRTCQVPCGPGNCGGCCSTSTTCAVGFANNACGSGGVACANCTAQNSTCNGLVTPVRCSNQQNTCPAPYPTCPGAVTMPVTPTLQNLCTDPDLDALQAACAAGADSGPCIAALATLAATNAACQKCIQPFAVPWEQLSGLYLCASPQVSTACRRSMGCATDCGDKSCNQCTPDNVDDCKNTVNQPGGGQCGTYVQQTNCAAAAFAPNQPCSPFAGNFGQWLRRVGDHFCGNTL